MERKKPIIQETHLVLNGVKIKDIIVTGLPVLYDCPPIKMIKISPKRSDKHSHLLYDILENMDD